MSNDITNRPANVLGWKTVALKLRNRTIQDIDGCMVTAARERFISLKSDGSVDDACESIVDVTHGVKVVQVEGIALELTGGSTGYYATIWCECHEGHPDVQHVVQAAAQMERARQDWKFAKELNVIVADFDRTGEVPAGFWPVADLPRDHNHGTRTDKFATWITLARP